MKRREFFGHSAASVLSLYLTASCRSELPINQKGKTSGKVFLSLYKDKSSSIFRIFDLSDHSYVDYSMPIDFPHSIIQCRKEPNVIYAFEFMGSCIKYNLKTREVVHIPSTEKNSFVGHGIQSDDGIWTTEVISKTGSFVRLRSDKDLQLVDEKTKFFEGGHHVVQLPGSSIISSGSNKQLTFYDTSKKEIVKKISMDLLVGHMAAISSTEVLGVGNVLKKKSDVVKSESSNLSEKVTCEVDLTGPAPMFYANTSGDFKVFWDENRKDLFKFGFGIAQLPKSDGMYLAGYEASNTVILWKGFEIVKIFNVAKPLGIVTLPDGSGFIVLSEGKMKIFSMKTLSLENEIKFDQAITYISRFV
jgi:hypothetical protein